MNLCRDALVQGIPMSSVVLQRVVNERDLRSFIRLPWEIYQGDPHWVPPLIRDEKALFDLQRNPFFDHGEAALFLARRDGRPVGRMAAIVNHLHNEHYDDRTGFWGFF